MKKNSVHTARLNLMVSPKLKKSIEIAAHANICTVSDYLRGLVYKDLMENSTINEDHSATYVVRHELP